MDIHVYFMYTLSCTFLMYMTLASVAEMPEPSESLAKISEIFLCSCAMRASQSCSP